MVLDLRVYGERSWNWDFNCTAVLQSSLFSIFEPTMQCWRAVERKVARAEERAKSTASITHYRCRLRVHLTVPIMVVGTSDLGFRVLLDISHFLCKFEPQLLCTGRPFSFSGSLAK